MIPGPRGGRVRAPRDDPPQHLRERAAHPRAHLRDAAEEGALLRRADVRRRGLRRVRRVGPPRRPRRLLPRARRGAARAFPEDTALGALGRYIARSDPAHYQPTNIAFGLLPELPQRVRDKAKKRLALAHRALESLARFQARLEGAARGGRLGRLAGCGPRPRRFLRHLELERNASPNTIRAYGEDLAQFTEHLRRELGREPRPEDADHLAIRGFLAELHRRGLAKSSSARKLAGLRTFFRYLCREGRLETNPARILATPRKEKRIPVGPRRDAGPRAPRHARATGSRRCAAARSWSCSTPAASAAPSSCPSTGARWTSTRAWSACSARAARSASSSSATARRRRSRAWLAGAGAAAAEVGRPLPERPRGPAHRPQRARAGRAAGEAGGPRAPLQPPHPAAQLRHPPPDARGGPAGDPGAARPREPQHHPALHPRRHPPPARGLQEGASPGVARGVRGARSPPVGEPDRPRAGKRTPVIQPPGTGQPIRLRLLPASSEMRGLRPLKHPRVGRLAREPSA